MHDVAKDVRPRSSKRQPREEIELQFWSEKWKIPIAGIERAIQKVGPLVKEVARELGRAG